MHRRLVIAAIAVIALISPPSLVSAAGKERAQDQSVGTAAAPVVPNGFSDTVVGHVPLATAFTWTPDGRMLAASKRGQLLVVEEAGNETALDLTATLCSEGALGLMGVAVDPDFVTNHEIYLFYTDRSAGTCDAAGGTDLRNRVSRFVLGDDNVVDPASEEVIVDNLVTTRPKHIGGDLEFGVDGYLYISVGDNGCTVGVTPERCGLQNTNAQSLSVPNGKILRVTRSGAPAPGNPYANARNARRCTQPGAIPPGTGPCAEIYASGFRHPYRFARRPGTNAFYINDVGAQKWEEIDRLAKGKNFGWTAREGFCVRNSTTNCSPVAPYVDPVFAYEHDADDCRSITGGAFVPKGLWPRMNGAYVFADYVCGTIWRLKQTADGDFEREVLVSGAAGPTHLRFGPDGDSQALYYAALSEGTIHRVSRP